MASWHIGDKFTGHISDLTHEGLGVCRIENRVIFVPNALPGDVISLKLTRLKKNYAYGALVEILEQSPDRVEPGCQHAPDCGGCQLQHLAYSGQLKWKEQQIRAALTRIGKLDVEVLPTLGMENPHYYRNKAQFTFGKQDGNLVMGFVKSDTHDVVDLKTCLIQHPLITKLALVLKAALPKFGIEPYDEKSGSGIVKRAVIRVSFSREELMLILITRTSNLPHLGPLLDHLAAEVPQLVSVAQAVNPKNTSTFSGPIRALKGKPHLVDTIGHLDYAISPGSFFQVNPVQTKVLYDLVTQKIISTGKETIFDLYCGSGTIGLYLAKGVKRVVGIESFGPAVADAKFNSKLNQIENAEFHLGKAEDLLPEMAKVYPVVDGVVIDPPRKGCARTLNTLIEKKVPKIVYVSCEPSTLARDLAVLAVGGYAMGQVQPVDMFPWTRHVETVVLMSRVEK